MCRDEQACTSLHNEDDEPIDPRSPNAVRKSMGLALVGGPSIHIDRELVGARPLPAVARELDRLTSDIAALDSVLGDLFAKLRPVRRDRKESANPEEKDLLDASEVTRRIWFEAARIRELIDVTQTVIDELEI